MKVLNSNTFRNVILGRDFLSSRSEKSVQLKWKKSLVLVTADYELTAFNTKPGIYATTAELFLTWKEHFTYYYSTSGCFN